MHEAELIKWRVNVGDAVKEHQTIAEMETDKAVVEVPTPWTGVISELCGNAGDIINVGSVLVRYKVGGAAPAPAPAPRVAAPVAAAPAPKAAATEEEREDAGTVVGSMSGSLGVPSRFARKVEHESSAGTAGSLSAPVASTRWCAPYQEPSAQRTRHTPPSYVASTTARPKSKCRSRSRSRATCSA